MQLNKINASQINYLQLAFMLIVTLYLLITVPQYWIQYPDSGVYLGTSQSLLDFNGYRFNFHPNLLYYPGTSIVLLIPLTFFGENFALLQGFFTVISLLGVYLVSRYFNVKIYGMIGFFVPFFVLFSSIFLIHFNAILSDTLFLTITFSALLCWRKYQVDGSIKYLILCAALVAFSSLTRLQGLFLCAAFGLAVMIDAYYKNPEKPIVPCLKVAMIGALTCLPFIIWTIRNYLEHSPDTYNMVNQFFFGLKGLMLYVENLPGNVHADPNMTGLDYSVTRVTLFFSSLFESWYGIVSQTNRIIITIFILFFSSLGLFDWFKKASNLERIYVVTSLLFILNGLLKAEHLYVVDRYWIPLLPFIVVMLGFGIKRIVSLHILGKWQIGAQLCACAFAVFLLIIASKNLANPMFNKEKLALEQTSIDQLSQYASAYIDKEAVIATVDWGVLPHTLQRKSFPILNDLSMTQNIDRMKKYDIDYLVSYGKYGGTSAAAAKLVESYPLAFKNIFSVNENNPRARLTLYKVNLAKIPEE